jgi:hypothetical protein
MRDLHRLKLELRAEEDAEARAHAFELLRGRRDERHLVPA